jgi:SAM-dependent methyltransferase
LKEQEDAYGRLILDHLEGKPALEIVERDDGSINASGYGPEAYFAPFRRWSKTERAALRFARGRALDVGVGAGRVAIELQERGHEVVGIDVSRLALEVARRRGAKDVRELAVTQVGRQLGLFDTIVMFGNNCGLFGSRRRAPWLLRRFKSVTTPQAKILAASTDPYTTDNPEHLAYHERNRRRGRMAGQLRIRVRHGLYTTPWFDYLLASPDELAELAKGTGWELMRVIGEGEPSYVGVLERVR